LPIWQFNGKVRGSRFSGIPLQSERILSQSSEGILYDCPGKAAADIQITAQHKQRFACEMVLAGKMMSSAAFEIASRWKTGTT